MTRARSRWLLAGTAALAVVWSSGLAGVPIYDGIGNPDEPYRYVDAPAGSQQTPAPTTAERTIQVRNGANLADYCNSGEKGPQISIYIPAGVLNVPAGASAVTMTAKPEAPSAPLPADGTIISNVYAVTATAAGQPVTIDETADQTLTISMRAPTGPVSGKPLPVFERRTPKGWEPVDTIRSGLDVYQANGVGLGDWALVQPSANASDSGSGPNKTLLYAGVGLLVVSVPILLIRMRRTRARDDE